MFNLGEKLNKIKAIHVIMYDMGKKMYVSNR